MRLEIRLRGVTVTEELRAYLKGQLRLALGRFARNIERVRVYLRDVNGPRGGPSKKCRIVVELPPRGSVVVTGTDTDVFAAVSRTANRARFAVRRHIKRRLARRRPPRRRVPGVPVQAPSVRVAARAKGSNRSKEHKMVLFPNQTVAHPDDMRERVQEEYRKHRHGVQPWDFVDEASWGSFPASDAPPWTLDHGRPHARTVEARGGAREAQTEGNDSIRKRTIIISDTDSQRLKALIDSARLGSRVREDYLTALEAELERARVVPAGEVPVDVVTMNSVVRVRDLDSDDSERYELVYPADADMALNRISILAPIGTAILGYRRGDAIEWPVPAGLRRLRVEEVLYQPERIGALHQ
jgi:regulator of nucleoside diphosphate kinase